MFFTFRFASKFLNTNLLLQGPFLFCKTVLYSKLSNLKCNIGLGKKVNNNGFHIVIITAGHYRSIGEHGTQAGTANYTTTRTTLF